MKRLTLAVFALLLAGAAFATDNDASRRIEASMVVTGWLQVATDGSVIRYTLDQQDKLPAPVVEVIQKTVPAWKFRPITVDGKAVVADAKMNLRVVASKQAEDQYSLRVRGATFSDGNGGEVDDKAADSDKSVYRDPSYKNRRTPSYPIVALRNQINGSVYLAIEVDRTGHVEQVVATQVNLHAMGREKDMRFLRQAFADASIAAAKDWTFNLTLTGPGAKMDHWTVMVPVNFSMVGSHEPQYGQWDIYVPGPTHPIPWEQDQIADGNNTDAVPGDGVFTPDRRFALLTPLSD